MIPRSGLGCDEGADPGADAHTDCRISKSRQTRTNSDPLDIGALDGDMTCRGLKYDGAFREFTESALNILPIRLSDGNLLIRLEALQVEPLSLVTLQNGHSQERCERGQNDQTTCRVFHTAPSTVRRLPWIEATRLGCPPWSDSVF